MIRQLDALRSRRTDEGFTLVEAVVSMVILAMLSTGVIAGANLVTNMTQDNRSRQVAVNLAEQQLDIDRGILDPFAIHSFGTCAAIAGQPAVTQQAVQTSVSGRTYTTSQCTSLVNAADGADVLCGSGKTISYRRITVTVDWSGRLATTPVVQSDTILSPNGRINDAATGSIAVQVLGSDGTGEAGVKVQVAPLSGGAAALQSQPSVTDVDGCSYALGVTPGTYTVTISRANSLDIAQVAAPVKTISVVAGSTSPVNYAYDQSGAFTLTYPAATLPTTMPVTFLSTGSPYISSSSSAAPTAVSLYPYLAGYTAIAGAEADKNGSTTCAANDPAAWATGSFNGRTLTSGQRGSTVAATPGGTAGQPLTVRMGTFTVKPSVATTITAVQQSVTTYGQPACASPQTFTFPSVPANTTTTLALPYGTYTLYSGVPAGNGLLSGLLQLLGNTLNLAPVTGVVNGLLTGYSTSTGVLTLDPRPGS